MTGSQNSIGHYNRGCEFIGKGRHADAARCFIQSLKDDPSFSNAAQNLSYVYLAGQVALPDKAEEAREVFSYLHPATPEWGNPDLIPRFLAFAQSARALPQPPGYEVSPWWQERQERSVTFAFQLASPRHVIQFAQSELMNFDQRVYGNADRALSTVTKRIAALEQEFGYFVPDHPEIVESPLSRADSIVAVCGGTYSTMLLAHLSFWLRINQQVESFTHDRCLEIGGGYGGLARVAKLSRPGMKWWITDLPESLAFSGLFLQQNFPDARVVTALQASDLDLDADFVLVPYHLSPSLTGIPFDCVINTGSLPEMPPATADYWMTLLDQLDSPNFYSWNYFMLHKSSMLETGSGQGGAAFIPAASPVWKVADAQLNGQLIFEVPDRSFLELFLTRDPARVKPANPDAATGSNDWWAWMCQELRDQPSVEILRHFLAGAELFWLDQTPVKNNRWWSYETRSGLTVTQMQSLFDQVDEVRWARAKLKALTKI